MLFQLCHRFIHFIPSTSCLASWLKMSDDWGLRVFSQWVKTLCYFCLLQSIFIALVGLGFSCLLSFCVLLSVTQYKQDEQSSMRNSVQAAQYKGGFALSHKLLVCPLKVTSYLPSGQSSKYQSKDRQENAYAMHMNLRHIWSSPHRGLVEDQCYWSNIIVQTWNEERIKNWANTLLGCPNTGHLYLYRWLCGIF